MGDAVAQSGDPGLPAVVIAEVRERDVTPSAEQVGRVEAVADVDIRARVEGVLESRDFVEGRSVKRGARLFLIEQEPYRLAVQNRAADLAGARAALKDAAAKLSRNQDLFARRAVSKAELESSEAARSIAAADVLRAEAAMRSAELDLEYTEIRSPIDGRVSRATYSPGNLVGPESGPLANVASVDPVYVTIAVSEKNLLWARRRGIDLDNPEVEPWLVLSDGNPYEYVGEFDYLDTRVSTTTDTILARAKFANPDGLLVPGQFVRVTIRRKDRVSAPVVPQSAVQEDREGRFVLVVNRADRVELRRVRMGDQVETDWVVEDGLSLGERVIVQGLQKVRADMQVAPTSAARD